jgi:hypothetical protein
MSHKRLDAEALLDLVVEAFRSEIAPCLPADKRYLAAMMTNALEICRRELAVEDEALAFQLLDRFYEDGDGSMAELSRDIRSGEINDQTHPDLISRLEAHLSRELDVRNPGFLASRTRKS